VGLTYKDIFKGIFTFRDPKFYLFFTQNEVGKVAAKDFLKRLKERKENRDKKVKLSVLKAQLKAIETWGHEQPADLSVFKLPFLLPMAMLIEWYQRQILMIWQGDFRMLR
jgi:hypothetical protein